MEDEIAQQLIELAENDLKVRESLLADNSLSKGYHPVMEAVHKHNASQLRAIIAKIGWPTRVRVGQNASDAAWLIVQHAIGEADFMRHCYELIQESVDDINAQNLAYLHDRICFFEEKPQKYGTQYDDGRMYPVEDGESLNALRQKMNLPEVEADRIVEASHLSHMYSDSLNNDLVFQSWRRRAGWI